MKYFAQVLFVLMVSISLSSCFKAKEPEAKICPEEPLTITTKDTLFLENCSKNYSEFRWTLPDGAFSTQDIVSFHNVNVGDYTITLSVKNNEYANDYKTERRVKVVLP